MTPNGQLLRGSAGPLILKDLGITDAALAAFLPVDAPRWLRGVLWCQFDAVTTREAIADALRGRYDVELTVETKYPEDGPPSGVAVPMVIARPKGRYVAYMFYGMDGERYVEGTRWQLEASFREGGTAWGSSRAVYERFKALELPALGATNIVERTE